MSVRLGPGDRERKAVLDWQGHEYWTGFLSTREWISTTFAAVSRPLIRRDRVAAAGGLTSCCRGLAAPLDVKLTPLILGERVPLSPIDPNPARSL